MIIELRFGINQKEGEEKRRKRLQIFLESPSLIFQDLKEDHQTFEKEMIKMGCV